MNDPTQELNPLGHSFLATLEMVGDAFRFQWQAGRRPRIEAFLEGQDASSQSALLCHLIGIDCECRTLAGERPVLEEYIERFPADATALEKLSNRLADDTFNPTLDPHAPTHPCVGQADFVNAQTASSALAGSDRNAQTNDETLPTAPGSAGAFAASNAPFEFGDYQILEKIAQGGMGVVYKARQRRLNRVVAMKMILSGQLADDDAVRRFYGEAEAAASLNHPHIVSIHEVGELNGQHFFSMDYIAGQSLADMVTRSPLPDRDAANYTSQVAEAMQYAHERGILHRDLKPANVLLNEQGQALITDFGLAKSMHTESGLTNTGQVLGTPSYMPPEQATGKTDEIDARSDVYSMGAILYCALTGRAPFHAANVVETIRQVVDADPVAPRQINPAISRDLETICLKCLEKQPSKRYASAQELQDDLQRLLSNQPIHARPVSASERLMKWVRRKPAAAALVGVSMLAIAAVIGITVAYNQTLQVKNDALLTAVENKETQRTIAEAQAKHAAQQSEVAMKTLAAVIDDIQNELVNVPGAHDVRKQLLAEAIQRLYDVSRSLESAPEANRYLAEAQIQLGLVFLSVGMTGSQSALDEANNLFVQANQIARKLMDDRPSDISRMMLSRSHEQLGEIARQRGDLQASLQHFQTSLDLSSQAVGEEADKRIYNTGVMQMKVGAVHEQMGETQKAIEHYETALELQQRAAADSPTDAAVQNALSFAHERMGDARILVGDAVGAEEQYQLSFNISRFLTERLPNDYRFKKNLASRYALLAKAKKQQNQGSQARELYQQQHKLCKQLYESDPNNNSIRHDYAIACMNLAEMETQLGDINEADSLLANASKLLETLANDDPDYLRYKSELGRSYRWVGKLKEALGDAPAAKEAYDKCIAIYEATLRNDPSDHQQRTNVALAYEYLGDVSLKLRSIQEAVDAYRTSLEMRRKLVEEDPLVACNNRNLSVSYNKFVFLNMQMGNVAEAREAGRKGLAIARNLAEANPANAIAQQDHAISLEYLGNVELTAGNLKAAQGFYEHCASIRETLASANPEDSDLQRSVSALYANLGVLSMEMQDWEAARKWFEKNLNVKRSLTERDSSNMQARAEFASAHERMGDVFGALGEHGEALQLFNQQLEILQSLAETDPANIQLRSSLASAWHRIGQAHLALMNLEQAREALEAGLLIAQERASADGANINHWLLAADLHEELGEVGERESKFSGQDAFAESLAIRKKLATALPNNERLQRQYAEFREKLNAQYAPPLETLAP